VYLLKVGGLETGFGMGCRVDCDGSRFYRLAALERVALEVMGSECVHSGPMG
jgi:hypothetical protein